MLSVRVKLQLSSVLILLAVSSGSIAQDSAIDVEQSPEAAAPIDLDLQAEIEQADQLLERTIRTRLAILPGMQDVSVDVRGGWVQLSGTVSALEQIELAEQAVEMNDGVLQVDNRLNVTTDVAVRVSPLISEFQSRGRQLISALPLLIAAFVIVAFSFWFGRWLSERKLLVDRSNRQPFMVHLLRQVIRLVTFGVGLLIALDLLGATALLGALLGTAGVAGIAFGFAFRDVAENYIAGILLSVRQPFMPKDFVVVDGHSGVVARLNSRATILITPDGNHLRLPNALVFKAVILNYTRNPTRRFEFELGVATDADLDRACELGEDTLLALTGVLSEPRPNTVISHAGESTIVLKFQGWVDQRETDFLKMRSEALRVIKNAFEREDIEMPDPGFRVDVREYLEAEAAEAAEEARAKKATKAAAKASAKDATPKSPKRPAADPAASESQLQRDVSPDESVERAVERERAAAKNDRLSEDGRQE